MAKNDKELKKLIEAAEKSVKESKQSRFDTKSEQTEEPLPGLEEDYSKGEWEQWGAQHLTAIEKKKPGSLAGTFIIIAVILALAVFAIFNLQVNKQEQEASTGNTTTLLKKMNLSQPDLQPGSGAAGFNSSSGIITHKGIPSAQRPANYKQPRQRIRATGTPEPVPTPRWVKENPPPPSTPAPGEEPVLLQ